MSPAVRRYVLLSFGLLVAIGIAFPPEWLRVKQRQAVGQLVHNGHYEPARLLYGAMAFIQRDPVALNNYHALTWAKAVPHGGKIRKEASISADQAWRKSGKRGVAAAYWNLAMFNIKHGRKSARRDRNATGWLRWAAKTNIAEARTLLDAGPKEYDRIEVLMELGDRGAAATMASVHWHQENQSRSRSALQQAAEAGHVASMARLGYLLATDIGDAPTWTSQDAKLAAEAERWLTRAANSGHVLAAYRLGECYAKPMFFCQERNDEKARKWFRRAAQPYPKFQPPEMHLDSQHAIRFGMMARWYVDQSGIAASAKREIEKLS